MRTPPLAPVLLALVLCVPVAPVAVAATASRPVQFAKGASSAVLKGSIKGFDSVDYRLRAGLGQTMTISLATSHPSTFFNVLPPGSKDVAIYNSASEGNQWAGQLQQAGEYTVRVYLYRNEARRSTRSDYTLTVGITGASGSADATVPGTSFHATGHVPCSMGTEAPGLCPFGVIRSGPGRAEVRITPPGGMERTLNFSGNQVSAPSSRSVRTSRQGDEWVVEVNGLERYRVADAVVNGG